MRGRKKSPNSRRNFLAIRLSDAEHGALLAAADHRRVTVTALVRAAVLEKLEVVGRGAEFSQSTHPAQ